MRRILHPVLLSLAVLAGPVRAAPPDPQPVVIVVVIPLASAPAPAFDDRQLWHNLWVGLWLGHFPDWYPLPF